eukprot:scaffold154984_cov31-Tisochrysis_lutea.AAC.6
MARMDVAVVGLARLVLIVRLDDGWNQMTQLESEYVMSCELRSMSLAKAKDSQVQVRTPSAPHAGLRATSYTLLYKIQNTHLGTPPPALERPETSRGAGDLSTNDRA